ncbi:ankyrin repeat-containing protein [Blastomyces dermatitidis ER-3]|uniref:Ankyrin repeat-containing protein n=1 Tax=Ajellomyces dermatitidis (strain ER-3 / ATCC MYA-2586) TaxID=559297 RepID=A0ABP2EU55_AJEDR|nr:ankyrin repeat-containing protein [Blastomyces dermatitidis ER-3]EEQ85819.2 ankyrin repeat-containing protein [Blastomyces dermatitidis ER-3]
MDALKLLVEYGVDINAHDGSGWPPMQLLISKGVNIEDIKWMLEHGADPNAELLAECGADLRAKHQMGWTALHFASSAGENDIVNRLALGLNINERCLCGGTPLWVATRKGHVSTVHPLLSRGADADISGGGERGVDTWTPLFVASRNGNEAIVEIPLEHGVDVDAVTHDEYTALAEAVLQGHERVASFLTAYATR